jgi:hypothetical protein
MEYELLHSIWPERDAAGVRWLWTLDAVFEDGSEEHVGGGIEATEFLATAAVSAAAQDHEALAVGCR